MSDAMNVAKFGGILNPNQVIDVIGVGVIPYPPIRENGPGGDPFIVMMLMRDEHHMMRPVGLPPDVAASLYATLRIAADRAGYLGRFDAYVKAVQAQEEASLAGMAPDERAVYEAGGIWRAREAGDGGA